MKTIYVASTYPIRRGIIKVKENATAGEVKLELAKALEIDLSDYKYSSVTYLNDPEPWEGKENEKVELASESHLIAIAPGSKVKTTLKERKKEKVEEPVQEEVKGTRVEYLWDTNPSRCSSNLVISGDFLTASPNPGSTNGSNFGIVFATHIFTTGKHQWQVRVNGERRYMYIGVCYCDSTGILPTTHTTVNNSDRGQASFFYEFDGDVRGPEGERHYGPALQDGDYVGVFVDCDEGTVHFTINGVVPGEKPVFRLPPAVRPLTPFVSIGSIGGMATISALP